MTRTSKKKALTAGGRKRRKPNPDLTVVTAVCVYHNSQPWFELTLRSLLLHRPTRHPSRRRLRILLLENPCRDKCPALARRFASAWGPDCEVIQTGLEKDMFGGSENHAFGLSKGFAYVKPDSQYTLFLDADIVFLRDGWLDYMLDARSDMIGPPAFKYLRNYDVPHAHPCLLLFKTKLAKPPYWNMNFSRNMKPPDGSQCWDTVIPFTMAMGGRDDVSLARIPMTKHATGHLQYFRLHDIAIHARGVSNLRRRPKTFEAKQQLFTSVLELAELLVSKDPMKGLH